MKKILITGGSGQIGWELQTALEPLGNIFAPGRNGFDLTDFSQMQKTIEQVKPDIIVNAAAYTAVDQAENDEAAAYAVNAAAPAILAEAAASLGALFVHFSTDYVFDGSSDLPYHEDDKTNPLNVYGRTKLAGEKSVRELCPNHLILRTSWVYGSRGNNFLLTMLRLGAEKDVLRIIDDQHGAPTWCRSVGTMTAQILKGIAVQQEKGQPAWGTYHLTCSGQTTWYGFAKEIFSLAESKGADGDYRYKSLRLDPITTGEYPLPARRPCNSVLSNQKLRDAFGLAMPDWKEALRDCMEEISLPLSQHRQIV